MSTSSLSKYIFTISYTYPISLFLIIFQEITVLGIPQKHSKSQVLFFLAILTSSIPSNEVNVHGAAQGNGQNYVLLNLWILLAVSPCSNLAYNILQLNSFYIPHTHTTKLEYISLHSWYSLAASFMIYM